MTREEAIKHGKEQLDFFAGEHLEFILMAIEALEQEPVVRCKDCKHWQEVSWAKGKRCINPLWTTARVTTEADFCSEGEREEE